MSSDRTLAGGLPRTDLELQAGQRATATPATPAAPRPACFEPRKVSQVVVFACSCICEHVVVGHRAGELHVTPCNMHAKLDLDPEADAIEMIRDAFRREITSHECKV